MEKKISKESLLGFHTVVILQVFFGLVFLIWSGIHKEQQFWWVFAYTFSTMIGALYMLYGNIGDWVRWRKNIVYVLIGLFASGIGTAFIVFCILKSLIFFFRFRWSKGLFEYLWAGDR